MSEQWTQKHVDKYVVVNKKLGQGTYGVVYNGFVKGNETQKVAVKTLPIKVLESSTKMMQQLKREIAILTKINHPNIVKLYDVHRTSNYLYMFLEYCHDGDLREYMNRKEEKRLSELEAVIFLKHITEGFRYLYELKIIHRDIKPANILLKGGVAKITDFGFARIVDTEMNDPAYFSRLGSPLYMSPQVLEGMPFSAKCDVWSLGIMLYELLYGRPPWMGENQYHLSQNIKQQPLTFPQKPVRSQKVKQLLSDMLAISERKDRITWEAIFEHGIIRMEEHKLKQNMQTILVDKDEVSKSISMNRIYMEQNLVVGYMKSSPSNLQQAQEIQVTEGVSSEDQAGDLDSESFLSHLKTERHKRDGYLKLNNYFFFERNLALFFNFVVQKIIRMNQSGQLGVSSDLYFRLICLITKNQIIHLTQVSRHLQSPKHENFDKDTWGKYQASSECAEVCEIVKNDLMHSMEFFNVVAKKTIEVQQQLLQEDPQQPLVKKFLDSVGSGFEMGETFHQIYKEVLRHTISILSSHHGHEQMLLEAYLWISLQPYQQFKNVSQDFSQFYEEFENLSEVELTEVLVRKRAEQKM